MDKEITITIDHNDGDYITEVSIIPEEDLNKIRPLIEAIKNFKSYKGQSLEDRPYPMTHTSNYPTGDCLREDMGEKSVEELYPGFDEETLEMFCGYCPGTEYGFHTVVSVQVGPITEKERLL